MPDYVSKKTGVYELWGLILQINRAIFVWPWSENAQTKQKQHRNENKAIWLVYRTDTNAPGFWLVKRTLGWKNFMPEELSRNRFDVILQHDWSIEQCLLHIRVFFGGKTKSPCFVLFNHWLTKQLTNTYRNHFSRTYENRSISVFVYKLSIFLSVFFGFFCVKMVTENQQKFEKEKREIEQSRHTQVMKPYM